MQLIGVVVIVLAVFSLINNQKKAQVCTEEVLAVISNIETYRRRRGHSHGAGHRHTDVDHDVYIEYTYAGRRYDTKLGTYNSSMRVGDTVNILVDPLNPTEFYHKSSSVLGTIILFILGIAFFIGGFFM